MVIEYLFKFEDKNTLEYKVDLEKNRGVPDNADSYPEWVKLGCEKCSNCPLEVKDHPLCPLAVELHEVVEKTADKLSYESAQIVIKTPERSYFKDTDLQSGLFSLMGLIMAQCDCPHFSFLKPLAKFHLPFSNIQETLFRSASSHLLKKYFDHKKDNRIEINLDELRSNYKDLEIVNRAVLERIKTMSKGDANKNAIVCLNIFAQMFEAEFENEFESLEEVFYSKVKDEDDENIIL